MRDAFRERGHDAYSADLRPNSSPYHIQGDVLKILDDGWDLMVGHPPCTYLCNSGVRWLHERPGRWKLLEEAAEFFLALWNAPIEEIALENPIPHRYAVSLIGDYQQKIQPHQFGHGESKNTCLWLKNLPPLMSTKLMVGREQRIWKMGPSEERSRLRSRTYPGIARAMAAQWG